MKCWEEALGMLRAPSALAPFIIFAALQFIVLVSLSLFSVTPLSAVMVPLVERLGGENALHYPMHMLLMPQMYALVYLPLAAVLGFSLFGFAVSLMVDYYERHNVVIERRRRRSTVALIPSMIVVGVINVTIVTMIQFVISYASVRAPIPMISKFMWLFGVALVVFVQVFMVYSLYFVITRTANPLGAIASSIRMGRRRLVVTALIIVTVVLIHLPLDALTQRADKVVLKFNPELVFVILAIGIAVEIFTNYFLFAATTSLATGGRGEGIR
jgi:hypothetical protein